jgi:hypothetical protein
MLFRNESPNLGKTTTIQEVGLTGASNSSTAASNLKPVTREIINILLDVTKTSGALSGWAFIAPWKCKIIGVRFVCSVVANSTQTVQLYTVPVSAQPEAPASGNVVTAAATPIGSGATANTPAYSALSTTAANLTMNTGDLLGYVVSGTPTSLVGGVLQVEVQQIG